MSRTRRAINGIATGYFSYIVITVVQIFLSPFILQKYGQSTLGAYASIMQLIGYLTLIEGALSLTFNRYFAQAIGGNNNREQVKKVLGAARFTCLLAGLFSALVLFIASFFIAKILGVDGLLAKDIKYALIALSVTNLAKSPFIAYSIFLNASQNMAFLNIISTATGVLRGFLIFILVKLDYGVSGIVLAGAITELLNVLVCVFYFRVNFSALNQASISVDRFFLREILIFSKNSLIIQVSTKIRFQTDTLLVGIFLSVSAASVFYSSITPPLLCFTLANILMTNAMPGINEIIGSGDLDRIKAVYTKIFKYVVALAVIVFFGILILNEHVVSLWVGRSQYIGWKTNIFFALQSCLLIVASFNGNFLVAMGKINKIARLDVALTLVGLLISVLLLKYLGMVGLVISSVLVIVPGMIYCFYLIENILGKRIFLSRYTYFSR